MSSPIPRSRPESGFLLIGVIMFVLALTILGISLYSLSSYEAEFQGNSRDSNEAFYLGQGGTEMVLKLLQLRWNLDDAQLAVTHEGVDSVYVSQPKSGGGFLTAGPMNDSVTTVTVVTSVHGNTRRMVGKYRPGRTTSYYTRLFTVGDGGVTSRYNIFPPPNKKTYQLWSDDSVRTWTNDADPGAATATWEQYLDFKQPHAMRLGGVPAPDVPSFMLEHLGTGETPGLTVTGLLSPRIAFNKGVGSTPTYYELSSSLISNVLYGVGVATGLDLAVTGTAIWMLPNGIFCASDVQVTSPGGLPATLVIVAHPQPGRDTEQDYGIYFFGGMNVDRNVNVILVTDGAIDFRQEDNGGLHYEARHLSMYCNRLFLEGPTFPDQSDLSYDDTRMTPVIQSLEQSGDLPRGTAAPRSSFAFVSGSWRDVTP